MTKYAVFNSNGTVERILEVSEALANPPPNFVQVPSTVTSVEDVTTDYYPIYSTYEIFRADNASHDLEQDLVAIESNISALQTGKSNTNHGHTADDITDSATKKIMTADERTKLNNIEDGANNYTHPTTHPVSMITGLSDVATSGSYNDLSDKPTIPEQYVHPTTHPASMITGLPTSLPANGGNADTVDNKHATDFATADHNHDTAYASISHTHAQSEITGLTTALSGKAAASHTHTVSDVTELDSTLTAINNDISALETSVSGKATANHTHSLDDVSETTDKKIMTAAERTKLSGISTGANNYTHPSYTAKTAGLYKVTVDGTGHVSGATAVTKADITGLGVPATDTTYSEATTSVAGLMSASDKTKLDGTYTGEQVDELLNGFANVNHNHDTAYISKSLQMTSDTGDVAVNWSNQDVVAKIKALPTGMCTAYAKNATTNNPKTTESWRFIVHKTSSVYGWVQAFGSSGSMYIGYVDNGTWKGWKCIYDATPELLWFGNYWITENQTVTPSKALSACRNGWVLVWSDYDTANEAPTNGDFFTTVIPKKNGANNNWSGQSFIAIVPHNMTDTSDDITCKRLYVHDTKITGHASNDTSPRNDVCLRAIYEF